MKRLLAFALTVTVVALFQTSLASAQILGTSGGIVQIGPPASLLQDQLASDTQAFAFDELQDVTLSSGIPVDITQPGLYDQPGDLTNSGTLPAGMVVDSHMVHSDKPGSGGGGVDVEGTVVVDNDIVGIQVVGTTLDAGDPQLGLPGTIYPTGFEQRQLGLSPRDDFIIEQVDRRTVLIHFNVNAHVDEVRIITESAKGTPAVTSEVHDSAHNDITGQTVAAGTDVHDKAIVTGSGPTPTGTVDFARFTNADCSGTPAATENDVALGGDGTAESSTFTTVAGGMAYRVHYDGDSAYEPAEGPCEPLHVEQPGAEGCTPGYWKQPQHFDSWQGYAPGDSFEAVFGRNAYAGSPTLLDALKFKGGGLFALGRQATAALLSASSGGVDYPFTTTQVIASFQAAFDSGNATTIENTKDTFDAANNLGCPLN